MKPLLLLVLWVLSSALFGAHEPCWQKALSRAVLGRLPSGVRLEITALKTSRACNSETRVRTLVPDLPLGFVQFEGGTAQIKAYLPIAVATHPLSHGESLTEENTRFEERELSRFSQSGYFHTREQLSTRKVKGYLAAGQVISRFNCQLPPQVTPGQTVDLIRRKSDLVLVAKVKALQSGMQNQWVQVQNPSSGKILLARITGPGEVEIQ